MGLSSISLYSSNLVGSLIFLQVRNGRRNRSLSVGVLFLMWADQVSQCWLQGAVPVGQLEGGLLVEEEGMALLAGA